MAEQKARQGAKRTVSTRQQQDLRTCKISSSFGRQMSTGSSRTCTCASFVPVSAARGAQVASGSTHAHHQFQFRPLGEHTGHQDLRIISSSFGRQMSTDSNRTCAMRMCIISSSFGRQMSTVSTRTCLSEHQFEFLTIGEHERTTLDLLSAHVLDYFQFSLSLGCSVGINMLCAQYLVLLKHL